MGNNGFPAIYFYLQILRQQWRDKMANAPNTCTNSSNESSCRLVGIAASYYFNLWICEYM
jgi:hypothetical protein